MTPKLRVVLLRLLLAVGGLLFIGGAYFGYVAYMHPFESCHRFEKQVSKHGGESVILVDSVCDGVANSTVAWLELQTSTGQRLKFFEYEAAYSNVQNYDDAVPTVSWLDDRTLKVSVHKVAAIRQSDKSVASHRVRYEVGSVMYR